MASIGTARPPSSMNTGLFSVSSMTESTCLPIVAEKNMFWRLGGSLWRMRRTSGQKPMSSIRSASSSTSIADAREGDVAALDHVEQAARRGDEQVDAAAHGLDLRFVADAAVHGDHAPAGLRGERLTDLFDLAGELARRRDDEGVRRDAAALTRGGCGAAGGLSLHELQDREHEGGRLARARLGAAHDVASGEDTGDRLFLDRRRVLVARRRPRRRGARA